MGLCTDNGTAARESKMFVHATVYVSTNSIPVPHDAPYPRLYWTPMEMSQKK